MSLGNFRFKGVYSACQTLNLVELAKVTSFYEGFLGGAQLFIKCGNRVQPTFNRLCQRNFIGLCLLFNLLEHAFKPATFSGQLNSLGTIACLRGFSCWFFKRLNLGYKLLVRRLQFFSTLGCGGFLCLNFFLPLPKH